MRHWIFNCDSTLSLICSGFVKRVDAKARQIDEDEAWSEANKNSGNEVEAVEISM
jgi:hypothetical protein